MAKYVNLTDWHRFPEDWGVQLGVAEFELIRLPDSMHMRLPVFKNPETGISVGMPTLPGEAPGSCYTALWIEDPEGRRAFHHDLVAALLERDGSLQEYVREA